MPRPASLSVSCESDCRSASAHPVTPPMPPASSPAASGDRDQGEDAGAPAGLGIALNRRVAPRVPGGGRSSSAAGGGEAQKTSSFIDHFAPHDHDSDASRHPNGLNHEATRANPRARRAKNPFLGVSCGQAAITSSTTSSGALASTV